MGTDPQIFLRSQKLENDFEDRKLEDGCDQDETDHFEWSKSIINLKPFWEAPDKKLGVKDYGYGPTNYVMRPKIRNHV